MFRNTGKKLTEKEIQVAHMFFQLFLSSTYSKKTEIAYVYQLLIYNPF